MSIQNFVPFIWEQALKNAIMDKQSIAICVNRLGENDFSQWGDTLKIANWKDIRVKAYAPDADIRPDDVLTIEHGAYFNFFVSDADKAQRNLSAVSSVVENAAERIAIDSEHYLMQKACEKAGTRMKMNKPKTADRFCELLVEVFAETIKKAGKCVDVSVCVPSDLVSVMAGDPRLEYRRVGDKIRAYCVGIQILVTPDLQNAILAMDNTAVAFAGRVTRIEAYRAERGFCDGVKGLYLCGAKVADPDHVCVCELM